MTNLLHTLYKGSHSWVPNNTILLVRHGSRCYGTNTPESDTDIKGVCIAPVDNYLGLEAPFEQAEFKSEEHNTEGVVYELRKFLRLAAECNPNIIEILFVSDEDVLFITPLGQMLRDNRDMFLSKRARHTFAGYAQSQLKRIKGHRAWLLDPPKKRPERADFDLPELGIGPSEMGALKSLEEKGHVFSENAVGLLQKEKAYFNALQHYKNYEGWKKSRNPARAALEAKCGYDCYHEDTEFLTESGWLKYQQISNQRLATVNIETGALEYQSHTNRINKPYNGPMFECHTQDGLFSITPNHQVLVSSTHRSKTNKFSLKYKKEEATWRLEPLSSLISDKKSYFHIKTTLQNKQQDYSVSDDYLRLIGLYASEGSMLKRATKKGTVYKGISISQLEFGRSCSVVSQITEFLYSTHSFSRKGRNELTFNFYNTDLANQLVHDCDEFSANKKLPAWISFLSHRQAKILLEALISGDGTERSESDVYYTNSPMLADQVQILGVLCGLNTKIWKYPYTDTIQVYLKKKPNETNTMKTNGKQASVKTVAYNGKVVCFTVPNGTLVTRLHGQTAIQGNCKHAMHLVRLLSMSIEILGKKGVNVKRTHDLDKLMEIRNGNWTYDQLIQEADRLEEQLRIVAKFSNLREVSDREAISNMSVTILRYFHGLMNGPTA